MATDPIKTTIPKDQPYPTTLYHPTENARHIVDEKKYRAALRDGFMKLMDIPLDGDRQAAWEREAKPGSAFPVRKV